jgi:hypothetical protein
MKILIINSDFDNFIITTIVAVTVLLFLIKWLKQKFESSKFKVHLFMDDDLKSQISNYTFSFEDNITDAKTHSIKMKITSIFMSLVVIVVPLYEVIETINPYAYIYYFRYSCFV